MMGIIAGVFITLAVEFIVMFVYALCRVASEDDRRTERDTREKRSRKDEWNDGE